MDFILKTIECVLMGVKIIEKFVCELSFRNVTPYLNEFHLWLFFPTASF
jgi:hypothetical protein